MAQTSDAQLAYLGFQLIPPAPVLRPYVGEYWSFRLNSPLGVYREEYMHPSGGFGLVFNLGDPVRLDGQIVAAPVFLDGVNTVTRSMGFMGCVDQMGIRFQAGGAFPFLGIPLIEMQNALSVLEALRDASLLDLHSRLYETGSLPARVALIEEWLSGHLSLGNVRSAIIPESLARLRRGIAVLLDGDEPLAIPQLAEDLAISQRQLEHLYRAQVGMTPTQYLRLQRIGVARLALSQKRQSNTHLAAALGYYDQAHFIREFSAVIGITPYAYMRRKHGSV